MQRNLTKDAGVSAAVVMLALATWLGTSHKADAWSPFDLLQSQPQQPDAAADADADADTDTVMAYAPDFRDRSVIHRHHHLWRHVRRHHRHGRAEMEARMPAAVTPLTEAMKPAEPMALKPMPPQSAARSTLQLVLTGEDGGDPFEQLMTSYYWSRLNHAIPADQIFEPVGRHVDTTDASPRHVTASLIANPTNR
jgi:hypothetical protein